jgi:hypothetical protein
MASTYSALKIELIGTGEQSGTWGATSNVNFDTALGEAITGSANVNFATAADVTITLTDTNTAQTARNLRLNITESSTGIGYTGNLILGAGCQIEKLYLINNGTTAVKTIKNTTGTGIAVPAGASMFVFNNSVNVVDVTNYISSLTLGSALPVASGGTNLTTFTAANNALYSTSASVLTAGTLPIAAGGTGATTLAGANIAVINVANTFTALQTFSGSSSVAALKTANMKEVATVSATAATGTINYDATTQSVLYYTTNASGNFTINFRASSGTTMTTLMAVGESMSFTFMNTNGATAYYNSAVQVDGTTTGVTTKWQGGTAPTSGNVSSIDTYTYVVIKTAATPTYTVLASVTKFA